MTRSWAWLQGRGLPRLERLGFGCCLSNESDRLGFDGLTPAYWAEAIRGFALHVDLMNIEFQSGCNRLPQLHAERCDVGLFCKNHGVDGKNFDSLFSHPSSNLMGHID